MEAQIHHLPGASSPAVLKERLKMPFTPIHVGIAMPVKAVSEKKFNLLTFAAAQVVMDTQPLVVMLTGQGKVHGWSHTFLAATGLGAVTAVVAKYALEGLARLFRWDKPGRVVISWKVIIWSALFGTFSHVLLDALIYPEMAPFWPVSQSNPLAFGFTSLQVILFCLACGAVGTLAWLLRVVIRKLKASNNRA
jgi:hypothetical protein